MTGNRRPVRTLATGDTVHVSVTHNGKLAEYEHHLTDALPARVASVDSIGNDVFFIDLELEHGKVMRYALAGGVSLIVT